MKDPRPASYSFVGRDPRAFFFSRSSFEKKPTDKSVAQGAAKPNSIKARGGLTFPDAESSYSNLAMLVEQEQFEDEMDPQEMSENLQLLRGRTLSRLVDEIFSPFLILSPTHLCPLYQLERVYGTTKLCDYAILGDGDRRREVGGRLP